MMRICLNWKVLAGLAAVGGGIYLIAPDVVVGFLPILLLAACPLSMMLMVRSMQRPQGQGQQMTQEPDVELTHGGGSRSRALHTQLSPIGSGLWSGRRPPVEQ